MEIVILFGGGDAGGIIITAHGIKRIPPFGPEVLRGLQAANKLSHLPEARELGDVTARLSRNVLANVAKATGVANATAVLLAEDDDVFVCGNGLKPGPIPHGGSVTFGQAA